MFGNHHDDSNDTPDDGAQAPGAMSPLTMPEPAAPPPPPPGFGSPMPDPAIDDLVSAPEPQEPEPASSPVTDSPSSADASGDNDDLLDIKQAALKKLEPLVGELEQSPEEKFRTTMMLIQATDDKTKIKDAYAAAQDIKDDKERAQALLDVVNEINYFSQKEEA